MVVPQRKFREIVFQMLFSQDLGGGGDAQVVSTMLDQLMVTKKTLRQACDRVSEIFMQVEGIDNLISKFSKDYDFNRISRVERNILRLGVFELLFDDAVPPKVAISESIRLSRKFGTPEGGAFVNAILDGIHRSEESKCLLKTVSKEESA
ncbi:MAG: transcription antitermination factor NusB [Simkaniaceae bacterium]